MRLSLWSVPVICLMTLTRAHGAEECAIAKASDIAALFDEWNLALASLSADKVAQRYWDDAVMLPTLSDTQRTTPALVRDYFVRFLEQRPRGRIDARTIHIDCNTAIDAGTYTFSLMDARGQVSEVAARYTYVYAHRKGAWKILHHHSSATPRPALPALKPAALVQDRPRSAGGSRPFLNIDASPRVHDFYPQTALAKREEGAVAMQICASAEGDLKEAPQVLQSSGSSQLDEAAQAWARAARWIPATHNNKPVDGCTKISVLFQAPV